MVKKVSCDGHVQYYKWSQLLHSHYLQNVGRESLNTQSWPICSLPQTPTEQQETRRSKSPSPSPAFMGRKVSNGVSPHRDPHWPHMGTSHTPTLRNPTQRPLKAFHRNLSLGAPEHASHKCSQDLSIPPLTGPSRRVWCHLTNQQHRGSTIDAALTHPQSSKTSSHCQHCPRWGSLLGERIMLLTLCNHHTWTGESQRSPPTGLQKSLPQRSSVVWALPQGLRESQIFNTSKMLPNLQWESNILLSYFIHILVRWCHIIFLKISLGIRSDFKMQISLLWKQSKKQR